MKQKVQLRTPISYYGGKQRLVSSILPLIPEHNLYCEPFLGGAAIFFSKEKSNVEVLNDTNRELINFYKVCQNRFHELQSLVRVTLHSREQHDEAHIIYNKPHMFDEVRRAWAVWVLATQSFSSVVDGSWGMDRSKSTLPLKITNKKAEFTEELAIRLQNVQLECADALYVINSRDTVESFHYIDPPYHNADMGHYDGYTADDFEALLKLVSTIKGKFLLSSYPSDLLTKYTSENNWHTITIEQIVSAGPLKKTERRLKC